MTVLGKAASPSGDTSVGADREALLGVDDPTGYAELHTGPSTADPAVAGCVCALRLPCGVHMREQRAERARQAEQAEQAAPPRRYRNTEGLRGHANARKRASD